MHFLKTDSSTYPLFLSSSLEKYRKLPLLLIPLFFLWFSWYVSLLVERIWSSRYTLRCFYFLLKLFFCVTDDSNPLLRRCLFCSAFLSSVHNNIFLPSPLVYSPFTMPFKVLQKSLIFHNDRSTFPIILMHYRSWFLSNIGPFQAHPIFIIYRSMMPAFSVKMHLFDHL